MGLIVAEVPALISAIVILLTALGGALKFAWDKYDAWRIEKREAKREEADKLEERFSRIEHALKDCEKRDERGEKRRAKMWTIMQLLFDAMEGLDPGHRTLQRAKRLLEDVPKEETRS